MARLLPKITVVELIEISGTTTFDDLVVRGEKFGLSPMEIYNQLKEGVESKTIGSYRGFAKPVVYQPISMSASARESKKFQKEVKGFKLDDDMVRTFTKFIDKAYSSHSKFRLGTVVKAMNQEKENSEEVWYENGIEKPWGEVQVQAALNKLTEDGYLIAGEKTIAGVWYCRKDYKKETKPNRERKARK